MSRGKQLDSTEETKKALIKAFLSLYAKEGMKGATVCSIAEKAGYARGTFYKYFTSTQELLEYIEELATPRALMAHIIDNSKTMPLEDATDLIMNYFQDRADIVSMLLSSDQDAHYFNQLHSVMMPMFRSLAVRAYQLDTYSLNCVSDYITSAKLGLLRHWAKGDRSLTLSQLNKITDSVFESAFWTNIALQAPKHGGPRQRTEMIGVSCDYPWFDDSDGIPAKTQP